MPDLAIDGGAPVRATVLPYGRQSVDEDDIQAVVEVLRSDWLTTGPKVPEFENAFAAAVGARHAVAVSSGTAALHAAVYALGIEAGDEVIVPAITFAATANAVVYRGGRPVFVDVDGKTLLIDPAEIEKKITSRTRAVIAVDYAGQPCDYDRLQEIADRRGVKLVADACHALGGRYKGRPVGSLSGMNTFSLHPVKHATTGEGGIITTDDAELAQRMRVFRNHGITSDHRQREAVGGWFYEMVDLGFNYRLTDLQCALGLSQLRKLNQWVARRQAIAKCYDDAFAGMKTVRPLAVRPDASHAYHLYVIELQLETLKVKREAIFAALRAEGIGVNVHYIPVPWHPYYQKLGYVPGQWPVAERMYERVISLPLFPAMTDRDAQDVIEAMRKVVAAYGR